MFKMQDGGGRHLEKSLYVGSRSTKFGTMTHFDPLDRCDRKNLKFLKIRDGGYRQLQKKRKIAISQGFELMTVNCKSNAITILSSHKLLHQCVTCSF